MKHFFLLLLAFSLLSPAFGQSSVSRGNGSNNNSNNYQPQTPSVTTVTYTATRTTTPSAPSDAVNNTTPGGSGKQKVYNLSHTRGQKPRTDFIDDVRYTHALSIQSRDNGDPVVPDPVPYTPPKSVDTTNKVRVDTVNMPLNEAVVFYNSLGKSCSAGEYSVHIRICDNLFESLDLLEKYESKYHVRGYIYRDFLLGNQKYRVLLGRFSKLHLAVRLHDQIKKYFPESYIIRFN